MSLWKQKSLLESSLAINVTCQKVDSTQKIPFSRVLAGHDKVKSNRNLIRCINVHLTFDIKYFGMIYTGQNVLYWTYISIKNIWNVFIQMLTIKT